MNMMPTHLEKLRQADLNLLITVAAIAEEKSITAASPTLAQSARREPGPAARTRVVP